MPSPLPADVLRAVDEADELYSAAEVEAAVEAMSASITRVLAGRAPLVLAVMIGGLVPAGKLLPRLHFPLNVDYIHATRYRGSTKGRDVEWRAKPTSRLEDRVVLLVDDILDEGLTLGALIAYCRAEGAAEVYSAVLVDKRHDRKPVIERADFTGLLVEDRYVFGSGMDFKGYHRNLPGIFAMR